MSGKTKTVDDDIFDFIYRMALNDAMNRASKKDIRKTVAGNDNIKKIVRKYADSVIDDSEGKQISFDKTVEKIQEQKVDGLTFGNIQKLINMTMKYLFIRCYQNKNMIDRFNSCNVPMDSIMRDFVYYSYLYLFENNKPSFDKYCAWSRIGEEGRPKKDYNEFQNAVQGIIEKKGIKNCIEFDYLFWDDAKKLLGKKVNEQREIVKKIWIQYDKEYDKSSDHFGN